MLAMAIYVNRDQLPPFRVPSFSSKAKDTVQTEFITAVSKNIIFVERSLLSCSNF